MTRRAVLWTAIGTGIAAAAVILFLASGFRLFAILSPSMGEVAPVGTLVVSHPAEGYQPGEIITFERGPRLYTHRIVDAGTQGYVTKGDLNATADPLPVAPSEVIGKAVWIAPGLGWVLRGLPWLALGGIVVFGLSLLGKLPRPWRWSLRISGWTLVFALVAMMLRPWINLEMLGFVPAAEGGVLMRVVNTGLFPVDTNGTRLLSGQDAVIHVVEQDANGFFTMTPLPALDAWQHLALLIFCLIPLAASLLIRAEPVAASGSAAGATPGGDARRRILIGAVAVAAVVGVATINQATAYGSFAATITNTANTAGTRTWFNCTRAETSTSGQVPYAAWRLGTAAGTGVNQTDLTGNGRTTRYTTAATVDTTSVGCNRDTPKAAVLFNGNKCLYLRAGYATSGYTPTTFSLEAWFRTNTKSNGRIIGFGDARTTAADTTYDRHLYLDKDGRVVFGVYPNQVRIVYTAAGTNYADGNWHHVVATLSTTTQSLYVDGQLAMTQTVASPYAENLHGYWKVGCGTLSGWQNAATAQSGSTTLDYTGPSYFTGWIQYAAIYSSALNATQVAEHFQAGQP